MADPEDSPTVTVVNADGQATDVAPADVDKWAARGFHPESGEARAARIGTAARTESEGVAAPVILHGLSAATFGATDAVARALGGADAQIQMQHIQEDHPYASLAGDLAGSLAVAGSVGKLGKAASEAVGGGLLGATVGGGAEGATYGIGNAVHELALSDDPLTAEHITSALSSNVLLGAGIGGGVSGVLKLGDIALSRAAGKLAEANAARSAIQNLPEDLANLDTKGLKEAAATERASLADAAKAERDSLEQLRVPQREELANQIHDLHTELSTERPIFHAVQGEDVEKIAGVKDIQVQMAKSFDRMRSAFDSPLSVARDPFPLIKPLEMRQGALEALQEKAPELRAALAGDSRLGALAHVDETLAQTKEQIANIQALAKSNPVQSGRLSMLTSGGSPRLDAIEAAREALSKAPDIGLVGKGAKGAAFAGATALAHMIPGVGIAAPFVGKAASDAVGAMFERMAGGVAKGVSKTQGAIASFLSTASDKVAAAAPVTATKVLNAVRFGEGPEPASSSLADVFHARSQELRQQTEYAQDGTLQMRPEARQAMAQRLAPFAAVNPLLADKIETAAARKVVYMSSKIPKRPEIDGMQIGPDTWKPSDLAIRSWARTVRACEDPHSVEMRLAQGVCTPEESEAYRVCYPERYQAMQLAITTAAPKLSKTLPISKKVALYVFSGVPTMPALQPNVLKVLQSNFAVEPGTAGGSAAPKPLPSFGALGSMKALDKPTPAQQRGS